MNGGNDEGERDLTQPTIRNLDPRHGMMSLTIWRSAIGHHTKIWTATFLENPRQKRSQTWYAGWKWRRRHPISEETGAKRFRDSAYYFLKADPESISWKWSSILLHVQQCRQQSSQAHQKRPGKMWWFLIVPTDLCNSEVWPTMCIWNAREFLLEVTIEALWNFLFLVMARTHNSL